MIEAALHEACDVWRQPGVLGSHKLITFLSTSIERQRQEKGYADDVLGRTKALQEVVYAGIKMVGPADEDPPDEMAANDPKWGAKKWRYYNILTLFFRYNLTPFAVAERIILKPDGGWFNRERKQAFKLLADVLQLLEGTPVDEVSPNQPPGGRAIHLATRHYISRQADVDFETAIQKFGQTFIIQGARQMGKTSLLVRMVNRLRQHYGARVVHFDLQSMGQDHLASLDLLLYELAESMLYDLGLDLETAQREWHSSSVSPPKRMERLLERHVLPRFEAPLVLALDEVDRLLPTVYRQDFFSMLRAWSNNRAIRAHWNKFHLILVISTEPYLLINDLNQSPFNVGHRLILDDFTAAQVSQLNELYGLPVAEADLPKLMTLLNGHPYLTSLVFYTMNRASMTWADLAVQANTDDGPFAEHLHHVGRLLNQEPGLKQVFAQILHRKQGEDELAQYRLLKAGLIKKHGHGYTCRCDLYRQYFLARL